MKQHPPNQIRAVYDENTIRVYQAYNDEIADAALVDGRFRSPPFKMDRMTWIKPSFLWMMYRAGWGAKDENQRRILAIDIDRSGFEWALAHGCPSHRDPSTSRDAWDRLKQESPVRIQWDPERDLRLEALPWRSIQIGLGNAAATLYVNEWIRRITDITDTAHRIRALVADGREEEARASLPPERLYPWPS